MQGDTHYPTMTRGLAPGPAPFAREAALLAQVDASGSFASSPESAGEEASKPIPRNVFRALRGIRGAFGSESR
jgi:hypothetical protein